MSTFSGERIAKVMARSGACSRRDAERLIAAGRVRVNGAVIDSPALNVTTQDQIEIDGVALEQAEETRLFLYHKPAGLVTSARDEMGRETVFDHLPRDLPRVVSVGRLDLNTEGLLLLTNDGGLSRYMELPQQGFRRTYRVRVLGSVSQDKLNRLKGGVTVEGVHYGPVEAHLEEGARDSANRWIIMTIAEGKNREVRKIMESLGLRVNRLIRLSYGPFALEDLPLGRVVEVSSDELHALLPGYFKGRS